MERLSLAVVGCGAVSVLQHLPALRRRRDVDLAVIVDPNLDRAHRIARSQRVPRVLASHEALIDSGVDAAIVATPNHLHAPITVDLLQAGMHVLVEKPMATTADECDAMIAAAERSGCVLGVGLVQRFSYAARLAKALIADGQLGGIHSYHMENGVEFAWPVASDYMFRREAAGGGVLIDLGVHVLDQALWWFGDVETHDYLDDAWGGLEADASLRLTHTSGIEGSLELSRTRMLRQRAVVRGEQAQVEVGVYENAFVLRWTPLGAVRGAAEVSGAPPAPRHDVVDLTAVAHDDFLGAIRRGGQTAVPGDEGRRSIALIEACYRNRRQLVLPWDMPWAERMEGGALSGVRRGS